MLCGAVCSLLVLSAHGGETTRTFAFHDTELLNPGQSEGGIAFVPGEIEARASAPLVVFLHGVNDPRALHLGLRKGDDAMIRLTRELARSGTRFIVAAPSHTRGANAAELLFPGFDLDELVSATESALGDRVRVDRSRVIVVGHSGGGCNPTGGLIRAALVPGSVQPFAFVAADTCLGAYVGDALESAAAHAKVRVFWQTWMWPRASDAFQRSFCDPSVASARDVRCEVLALTGADAHDQVLGVGLRRVLPELLNHSAP
ncbi:hypothetical protein BH09MYX1_BH09MYX1_17740 [soil metagenome]